ncbi:MAG: hypothetical protein K2H19_09075 [Ruminococcus sp.]|nr:hypothetical protein [Ruminococcus sp.]
MSGNSANGVTMQIQVLTSVLLVVLAGKKGFLTSFILNIFNFAYTLLLVVKIMGLFLVLLHHL